mgnify:CR=1 FL=1
MVNIFIMTGLLIMGITDIKRKAVPSVSYTHLTLPTN